MKRDYNLFPQDDNGEVLWELRSQGDALTEVRELDFTVILPSEEAAIQFAVICLRGGLRVELSKSEESHEDGLDWEVLVYTDAIPTHADITALEHWLGEQAAPLGGRTSGWSSIFVPSE